MVMAIETISYLSHFLGYQDQGIGEMAGALQTPGVQKWDAEHLFPKKGNRVRYLPWLLSLWAA